MSNDLREINWRAFMRWVGWKIIQIFCVFLCYWVCYTLSGELGLAGVQRAVFTTFIGSCGLCFLQLAGVLPKDLLENRILDKIMPKFMDFIIFTGLIFFAILIPVIKYLETHQ